MDFRLLLVWVFRGSSGRSERIMARESVVDSGLSVIGEGWEFGTVRNGPKSEATAPSVGRIFVCRVSRAGDGARGVR